MALSRLELGIVSLLLVGCSGSGTGGGAASGGGGAGIGAAAGAGGFATGGAAGSGATAGSGGSTTTGGSGGGGSGGVSVKCQDIQSGPTLVVVSDAAGSAGKSETTLRVPLWFDAPVTGVALDSVEQQDGNGALVRSWKATDFQGPPGFDGSVSPDSANYIGVVLAATSASVQGETDACATKPWERSGTVVVKGTTDQSGTFQIECPLGVSGKGPEPLHWACAKGLPGWLEEQTGITNVTSPVVAALASSEIHVENGSSSALTGFSAESATLYAYFADPLMKPCTAPPDSWDFPAGGQHDLWRGQSSNDIWSGPVAPGTTDWANWMWQLSGAQFPSGVCFKPQTTPPPDPTQMCQEPTLQIVLRGSSSAGAWQWESDLFDCYDLSGT